MFHGEIELLRIGGTEVRGHREHSAKGSVCDCEVDGLQRQEAVTDPRADVDIARRYANCGTKRKLPEQTETASLVPRRIVEHAEAAANHRVRE
jgi:hypothetical protein